MNPSQHGAVKTKGSVQTMQHKCFAWAMSMAMAAAIACTGCTSSDTNPDADSGTSTQITTAASDTSAEETDSKKNTASAESLSTLQDNVTAKRSPAARPSRQTAEAVARPADSAAVCRQAIRPPAHPAAISARTHSVPEPVLCGTAGTQDKIPLEIFFPFKFAGAHGVRAVRFCGFGGRKLRTISHGLFACFSVRFQASFTKRTHSSGILEPCSKRACNIL